MVYKYSNVHIFSTKKGYLFCVILYFIGGLPFLLPILTLKHLVYKHGMKHIEILS